MLQEISVTQPERIRFGQLKQKAAQGYFIKRLLYLLTIFLSSISSTTSIDIGSG